MIKLSSYCLTLSAFNLLVYCNVAQAKNANIEPKVYENASYSELQIGAEVIGYSETLGSVKDLGRLSQDVKVANPTIRQSAYSSLNQTWGFFVESAATLGPVIEKETWTVGNYGHVQQNDFAIQANEVGLKLAYHWTPAVQITLGSKIATSSFTRSHFSLVEPGANELDQALIDSFTLGDIPNSDNKIQLNDDGQLALFNKTTNEPVLNEDDEHTLVSIPRFLLPGQDPQPGVPKDELRPLEDLSDSARRDVSNTETQLSVNLTTSLKYDSYHTDKSTNISWYAESEFSVPMYNKVTTTIFETTDLVDYFNGWGATGRLGVRYHITANIAFMIGVTADYHERDVLTEIKNKNTEDEKRIRVPYVKYSNVAYHSGMYWSF